MHSVDGLCHKTELVEDSARSVDWQVGHGCAMRFGVGPEEEIQTDGIDLARGAGHFTNFPLHQLKEKKGLFHRHGGEPPFKTGYSD